LLRVVSEVLAFLYSTETGLFSQVYYYRYEGEVTKW
jgi:hypothetical protein